MVGLDRFSARGGAVLLSGLYPACVPSRSAGRQRASCECGEGSGRLGHYFPGCVDGGALMAFTEASRLLIEAAQTSV
jgi:hypothetical protein